MGEIWGGIGEMYGRYRGDIDLVEHVADEQRLRGIEAGRVPKGVDSVPEQVALSIYPLRKVSTLSVPEQVAHDHVRVVVHEQRPSGQRRGGRAGVEQPEAFEVARLRIPIAAAPPQCVCRLLARRRLVGVGA